MSKDNKKTLKEMQQTSNNKRQTSNFLIVGQGLAGSLLLWELHRKGYSVAVVDEGLPVTSSKVAAGMFNPINTKRFTVSSNAETVIPQVLETYRSMEAELGISIVHMQNIYNVFGNNKEANDYTTKLDHPFFRQYTNGNPEPEDHIRQPFGVFEVGLSGWIDLKTMLASMRSFIAEKHILAEERFDYDELKQEGTYWTYKNITTDKVVFCEGINANNNPFFPDLNIIPCKGDVLEFDASLLHPTRVIKKGVYIVPIGNGRFRCGSTYRWENADATPLAADKEELTQKITELIDVPFTIVSHQVAVRPTTKTRETVVAAHPTFSTMFALNGLGTKGVVNGVKAVQLFMKQFN
jgi:glycine/D-amino acid oxidase-like deaminating enzyme